MHERRRTQVRCHMNGEEMQYNDAVRTIMTSHSLCRKGVTQG